MFQPWRRLGQLSHIRVIRRRLPDGVVAWTDGHSTIWLDHDLLQSEERSALTHELVHIEWAHFGEQPPSVEVAVRVETARRLISMDDLIGALQWSTTLEEAADELCVTPEVLTDRVEHLEQTEARRLADNLRGWHAA